ncbi:hypothetical protein A3A39_00595 [Candidatus Kaiserbacteria bacterium RIFCSPLOWO2_01_FULL_54_13]|uniref:Uncharacterized protein n=1 Tax=Candidatus Kaiserbacteria bacterium RIFCSPLOWO2_01_FULL_54_13 TaxID=1798512 RepID=A0A1F6F0L8_9BACT|nr:MAG: hypothetical protein A3A39_00595 [Candidatus Kaiserbacteria bacterium RIFCSPLOWO2_01_FULL_54_13]
MKKVLADIIKRAENWPKEKQEELAEIVSEIDAKVSGVYHATPEELKGIDRGLNAAREGRFATKKAVEAAFAKFRRT